VPVAIERGLDRGVAELRLDVFRVGALRNQQTRVGVAQIVESATPELRAAQHAGPHAVGEVVRIDRLAVRVAEDESAPETARELSQRRPQRRRQADRPARTPGLRCDELPPPERSADEEAMALEIDVLPLEPEIRGSMAKLVEREGRRRRTTASPGRLPLNP
jgi:hypothetical protein